MSDTVQCTGPAERPDAATAHAWAALGGGPEAAATVTYRPAPGALQARLPVRELARATVGVCSLAAAELVARRRGTPLPAVQVDEAAVATAFVSERHLRIDGRAPTSFAPLSGFWRAADGWVRTHANYPHHRARLLAALELAGSPACAGADPARARAALAAELAGRPAHAVQEAVYAAGGLAVAVAPAPPGVRTAGLPLVETRGLGEGPARRLAPAALPAEGVRVLDLTRVIAGPVATRTLALLGADVLRVDPPAVPEDPDAHADTGIGKRSTLLDLADPEDRRAFDALVDEADVIVGGYRPGALAAYGLTPDALAARRPGLIVAELCAWGHQGPWAGRRGFDSLVQAASGIAAADLSVDALAARARLSPRHFARAFRAETGVTPGRYVERVRLEHARRLLEETCDGVEEVSRASGYGTPEAMRRAFVRALGTAPAAYRRRFHVPAPAGTV
ncbi:CoA transferase [Streptomyces sp. NPDC003860]